MAYSEIRKCWKCKDQHLASITCDEWKDIRQRTRLSAEAAAKRFGSEIADLKRKLEECEKQKLDVIDELHSANNRTAEERAHAGALAGALEKYPYDDAYYQEHVKPALTAYRKYKEPGE